MSRLDKALRAWTVKFARQNGLFAKSTRLHWQRLKRGVYTVSDGEKTYKIYHASNTWRIV